MSLGRTIVDYVFVAYLLAGVSITIIFTAANNINSQYSSNAHKKATIPAVFKPIEFILKNLF